MRFDDVFTLISRLGTYERYESISRVHVVPAPEENRLLDLTEMDV